MQTYIFTVAISAGDGPVQDGMNMQSIADLYRNEVIAGFEGQNANRSDPVHYDVYVTQPVRVSPPHQSPPSIDDDDA